MARVKPLDLAVVQAWLAAWDESDVFSDASVRHLQSPDQRPFLPCPSSRWESAASRVA